MFDVKQGWEPLCKFLNVPIPDEPFPHENDREFFKVHHRRMERTGNMIIASAVGIIAIALAAAWKTNCKLFSSLV